MFCFFFNSCFTQSSVVVRNLYAPALRELKISQITSLLISWQNSIFTTIFIRVWSSFVYFFFWFYCDQSSYKQNRFTIFLGLARRKVVNQLRVHQVRHSTTPGGWVGFSLLAWCCYYGYLCNIEPCTAVERWACASESILVNCAPNFKVKNIRNNRWPAKQAKCICNVDRNR